MMKRKRLLLSLLGFFLAFASYAQVYERVVLEDAFGNDAPAEVGNIQGAGKGNRLYIKGAASGAGIRETFIKFSLEDMDNLTSEEVDYAKVELRIYTIRTNADAAQNQVGVYPVANDWTETTLTWTNSRDLSAGGITAGMIASGPGKRIAGYSGSGQQGDEAANSYNEANESRFDISAYAIAQYKAGNKTISVMLHVNNTVNNGDQQLISKDVTLAATAPIFDSKELILPKVIVTTPAAEANFTTPAFGIENFEVAFTNTSVFATSYAWNFGDGGSSTEANPTHTYTAAGDYTVTLTVNGNEELVKSKSIHIYPVGNETILGSDMEVADRDFFIEFGASNLAGGTNDQLVWGTVAGESTKSYKPTGFESDGFLTVCEDWSAASSYVLAQAVYMEAGSTYKLSFDYHVNNFQRAWWDIYIGTTVPSTNDYSDNKIAGLIAWNTGTVTPNKRDLFEDFFIPETSGVYFIVLKWGCGAGGSGYFNTSMDNLKLEKQIKPADPIAAFKIKGFTVGIAPFDIELENTSQYATEETVYAWDFGDEETSAEENPTHTFQDAGTYEITLTIGESVFSKTIVVVNAQEVNSAEKLVGGDMESVNNWFFSWLDGQVKPTLTWDYEGADIPSKGSGKGLKVEAPSGDGSNNAFRKNMCIYQPVYLTAEHTYEFDMAINIVSGTGMWLETYLENFEQPKEEWTPGSGASGTNLSFAKENKVPGCMGYLPNTFNAEGHNGLFGDISGVIIYTGAETATNAPYPFGRLTYKAENTGMYFFILKIGGNSGASNHAINIVVDNLSLKDPSLITKVKDMPSDKDLVYSTAGKIQVVTENTENVIAVYGATGLLIESGRFADQFTSKNLPVGLYIVKLNGNSYKVLVK